MDKTLFHLKKFSPKFEKFHHENVIVSTEKLTLRKLDRGFVSLPHALAYPVGQSQIGTAIIVRDQCSPNKNRLATSSSPAFDPGLSCLE